MSTSRFLFLLLLTGLSASLYGQTETLFRPSLRVGYDVSALARRFLEPEVRSTEFWADWEWQRNWFAAIEGGLLDVSMEKPSHTYEAGGWFLRIGADYNFLDRKDAIHQDLVIASARYGIGSMNQQAPHIVISDPYWGDFVTSMPAERHLAHWLEIGGGVKTRIGRDFFMGWAIRTRFLLSQSSEGQINPLVIPGYGRPRGNTSVMLHYTLYYRLPL
jgi:hypothetical protein